MDPPIPANDLQYESVQWIVPYEFMVSPNRLDLAPDTLAPRGTTAFGYVSG